MPKLSVLLLLLVLGNSVCMATAQKNRALVRMLQEQGFTGALRGDIHFTTLGTLRCAKSNFRVVYFEWYGPAHPGSHRAQYRLLFLEGGDRYVGSYVIRDKPVLNRSDSVLFGYDNASGNVIKCSEIGSGKSVQLDGDWVLFEK
jgi:hypothetical protein